MNSTNRQTAFNFMAFRRGFIDKISLISYDQMGGLPHSTIINDLEDPLYQKISNTLQSRTRNELWRELLKTKDR